MLSGNGITRGFSECFILVPLFWKILETLTSVLSLLKFGYLMRVNLTFYVHCIMFQCVDKPTRCNTSYE